MGFQIQDGTGSSRKAAVSNLNRILVDSITEERAVYNSIEEGNTFVVSTNFFLAIWILIQNPHCRKKLKEESKT